MMQLDRQQSPIEAVAPAAAAAASSASSNTQHSNVCNQAPCKRTGDTLQTPHALLNKRRRPLPRHEHAVEVAAADSTGTTSSSGSSSCSTDEFSDTATSPEQASMLQDIQQLYAAVRAGQQSLKDTLQMLLHSKKEKTFISFLRYVLHPNNQQQQQLEGESRVQQGKQQSQGQQQQQHVGQQVLDILSANNYNLFSSFLQLLSNPDNVTCYIASAAFHSLTEATGPHRVLAALLSAPNGVQLLLAALDEDRLRQAYQQGFVMTVTYSGRQVVEPLCSGTVGYLIGRAKKHHLQELVRQLVAALTWRDESASVAAAMALVIVARNAAAGAEAVLPYTPLLLAASQHPSVRVSKRVLLALKVMAEIAAAAANTAAAATTATSSSSLASSKAAASMAAAMAQHDLAPLAKLMLCSAVTDHHQHMAHPGAFSTACVAADVIQLLAKVAPEQPGITNAAPALIQVYQEQGPASLLGGKAVQILLLIGRQGSTI